MKITVIAAGAGITAVKAPELPAVETLVVGGDFGPVIQRLTAGGMTERSIAQAVGMSKGTVHRIRSGATEPKYTQAVALLELARKSQ